MDIIENEIEQRREELRQQGLDQIVDIKDLQEFKNKVDFMFAHFGLDLKPEGIIFLETRDWTLNSHIDKYREEVKSFLKRHIR